MPSSLTEMYAIYYLASTHYACLRSSSCPRSSSFLPVIQLLLDMLVEVVRVEEVVEL